MAASGSSGPLWRAPSGNRVVKSIVAAPRAGPRAIPARWNASRRYTQVAATMVESESGSKENARCGRQEGRQAGRGRRAAKRDESAARRYTRVAPPRVERKRAKKKTARWGRKEARKAGRGRRAAKRDESAARQ